MGASLPSTRREFERARFEQLAARALRTNGASPSEPATNPTCSRCGRKNDPQATFCDRCGKALHRGLGPSPGFARAVERAIREELRSSAQVLARREGISEAEAMVRLRARGANRGGRRSAVGEASGSK